VEIPMVQAVLRSLAVNATKGSAQAQRDFTALARIVERGEPARARSRIRRVP